MGQWVTDTIRTYRDFNEILDNKNEKSLFHLAASMMKILNNFQEISLSKLHQHEREMLENALYIFSKYCLGQIKKASEEVNIEKKAELIEDIEDSVVKMFDVMRNVIEGTGGINWQYIQNPSFSTSLYQVSPKYWDFYMKLIQNISDIFNTNEMEYAFVLQPTLKNCIQTELLLEKKDTSGKVVILYVPVYQAENVKYVSICLIHEAFHVLTKSERRRKDRASAFIRVAYLSLKKIIFEDIVLDEEQPEMDNQLKEMLFAKWMNDALQALEKMSHLSEMDKRFYSKNLMSEIGELFWEQLYNSKESLSRDVFVAKDLHNYEVLNNYSEFEKECKMAEEIARKLEFNISSVVCQKKWIHTLKLLMEMFRECYADVLTLILTMIDSAVYENAFLESAFFAYSREEYCNSNKQLRMMLVGKTLSAIDLESDDWEKFYLQQRTLFENEGRTEVFKSNYELEKSNINLGFTSEMEEIYLDYLVRCAHSFMEGYGTHPMVERFQKDFKNLLNKEEESLLFDMLQFNAEYLENEGEIECAQ